MEFVLFQLIVLIATVYGAPGPHKLGFGLGAVAVAEPIVPVPVVQPVVQPVPVPVVQPVVQPIVQPVLPVVQPVYPIIPVFGRFG